MKVLVYTFGCQMNKLDSELVLSALRGAGYTVTDRLEEADVVLFNTCSVREHAEERVYSRLGALKRLKQNKPELLIGVLGCMAQKDGAEILRRAPHVDLVCGTRMFPRIADLLDRSAKLRGPVLALEDDVNVSYHRVPRDRPNRFQAYVSVMRGCDNFCSYCVVPYVRGREVSRPFAVIVDEVRRLVDDGCVEVTLLGQNVNSYGKSLDGNADLPGLVGKLQEIEGLHRIRFITSHPKDITRKILEAMRDSSKVCEYLHMPAQSGSDDILGAMRRGYTAARYRELVATAREMVPGVAISSDFIVGFPGETEADFERTVELARDCRFQNSFVFKYSPRRGTHAAQLADDVPREEKRRRNNVLLREQEKISFESHRQYLGRTVEVLVEGPSKKDSNMLVGRLRTNHIVHFPGSQEERGRLREVCVTECTPLTLLGELVETRTDAVRVSAGKPESGGDI